MCHLKFIRPASLYTTSKRSLCFATAFVKTINKPKLCSRSYVIVQPSTLNSTFSSCNSSTSLNVSSVRFSSSSFSSSNSSTSSLSPKHPSSSNHPDPFITSTTTQPFNFISSTSIPPSTTSTTSTTTSSSSSSSHFSFFSPPHSHLHPPPFFSPTLPKYQRGPFINVAQYAVCSAVGIASYLFLRCFNKLKVHPKELEALNELVLNRPKGTPLITISNHASTIDDPILWGLLPFKAFAYNAHKLRWSLGAQEICYSNWLTSMFFSFGRVLPIIRGNGVYQAGMNSALELLSKGHWIHIFPEGKVHQAGGILRFKWGVGRLIAESTAPPIVVLIHHTGFSKVYPLTPTGMVQQWLPKFFQRIKVKIDDPVDTTLLRQELTHLDPPNQWKIITDYLQQRMLNLALQNEDKMSSSLNI